MLPIVVQRLIAAPQTYIFGHIPKVLVSTFHHLITTQLPYLDRRRHPLYLTIQALTDRLFVLLAYSLPSLSTRSATSSNLVRKIWSLEPVFMASS
ncbi:hypothetical protein C0991_004576, partial [Blastosporella zonata]